MNTRFIQALRCSNKGRPPIWVMRQAGRYLPEYRALRKKHTFLELCHHPELIAQVTLLPLQQFAFDAAILFSDILVIAEALGLGLKFEDSIGPIIERPLKSEKEIQNLPTGSICDKLQYVSQGIKQLLPGLKVPLIGFCGAPFTVASYLIEGRSSKSYKLTKQWMMREPESFHLLLEKLTQYTIEYLKMQIEAGVHAIQIFDSWASILSHHHFIEFSLAYLRRIIDELKKTQVPIIFFCRGSSVFAKLVAQIAPSGISVDWNADLADIRRVVPSSVALQGNLDPDVLYGSKETIQKEVTRILVSMKDDPGYIFNLGHGIYPDTPVESVQTLVQCVHSFK